MRKVASRQRRLKAPRRSDRRKRLDDEGAIGCRGMRDGEGSRAPSTSAPVDDVEIEHTRRPSAAAASAEFALDGLERPEHLGRIEIAFDERDGIGEIAAGSALGAVLSARPR